MIIFNRLFYKNFLSTGSAGIELQLDRSQLTLITALNGSGKSTALDAICFVLYGKAYRNVNKPNLVNSINGKNCEAEIEFTAGPTKYRIVRGIKPAKFEIYENGFMINQNPNVKDYQLLLETQILKMNYTAFTQVVVMGSTNYIPFMRLSSSQRRDFVENLLDIKIFSLMADLLKSKRDVVKDELKTLTLKLTSLSEKIELQQSFISSKIADREQKLENLNEEVKEVTDKKSKYEARYASIEKELESLTVQHNMYADIQSKIDDLETIKSTIEKNIRKYTTEKNSYAEITHCPTCFQDLAEDAKVDVIAKYSSKIDEFNTGIAGISVKMAELSSKIVGFNTIINRINRLNKEQSNINQSVHGCNLLHKKTLEGINVLMETKSSDEEAKLEEFNENYSEIIEQQAVVREESHYFNLIQHLLKDSGIKAKIISQYVPVINKLVNKYLGQLDFYVLFNIDEQFNEVIKSRHRDMFTYESFSAGEKQKIDLALMLTWREIASLKNSAASNLLFLDEILDASLDSTVLDLLMNILESMHSSNIFVISHREGLQDKFRSVIRLEKQNNFTVLL